MTPIQKLWWKGEFDNLTIYDNWRDCPWDDSRWPDFSPWEFYSKGDGKLAIDECVLDMLQRLRTEINRPIQINSAYRSPKYNKKIGGAKWSMHKIAIAYDIDLFGHDRELLTKLAKKHGFNGIGQYNTFIHIDARPWDAGWVG